MRPVLVVVLILCSENIFAKWYFDMQIFQQCKGSVNTPQIYNNSKIFVSDGTVKLDYDIYISKDLTKFMEASWAIESCRSKENLNTCMPLYKFKTAKTCEMINGKREMWTSFVDCISPQYHCPIKKGFYKARNCTVDVSLLALWPISGGYWKCNIMISDSRSKKLLGCLNVEGEIRQKY